MTITQDIIDALNNDIQLITSGDGYNTDIVKCHKVAKELKNLNPDEFDSFYVQGGDSKSDEAEGLLKWTWLVGIEFYLSVDSDKDEGLLSQKAEKLKEDIHSLWVHWLNNDGDTTLGSIDSLEQCTPRTYFPYFDNGDTRGVFDVIFEIIYNE